MDNRTGLAGLVLTLLIFLSILYFIPISFMQKQTNVTLVLESPIIFLHDKSRGVEVSVLGHSYEPPGMRRFVSRVYHYIPGYETQIDAVDVTGIMTKNTFFITRKPGERQSPIGVKVEVKWQLWGESKERNILFKEGLYNGSSYDSDLKPLPVQLEVYEDPPLEYPGFLINLSEVEKVLVPGGNGDFSLRYQGTYQYIFETLIDGTDTFKGDFEGFMINASLKEGALETLIIYYPMTSLSEEVAIPRPSLVRGKRLVKAV